MNAPLRKSRRQLIWISIAFIAAVGISIYSYSKIKFSYLRSIDEQVVFEVEPVIRTTLFNLPHDSEIARRYGHFRELTDIHWRRASHPFRLTERIDWQANAVFENATAPITIHIAKGTSITFRQLEMRPTEKWGQENSGDLVLTSDGHFRVGGTLSMLSGRANHPNFVHEDDWFKAMRRGKPSEPIGSDDLLPTCHEPNKALIESAKSDADSLRSGTIDGALR